VYNLSQVYTYTVERNNITMMVGISAWAFSFYACLAPMANLNQPKVLVCGVDNYCWHLNRIARRLEGKKEKYAGGGGMTVTGKCVGCLAVAVALVYLRRWSFFPIRITISEMASPLKTVVPLIWYFYCRQYFRFGITPQ
jgi:hypothetical protein